MTDPLLPDADWRTLSPRFVVVRQVSALASNLIFWTVATVASWVAFGRPEVTVPVAVAGLAWTGWRVWRAKRWVNSWRWAERDADLCIRKGLWNRTLTVIPFGRMQVVEVSAGPILRWQGLADVKLVTAAIHSDAHLPGLTHADAIALRDRMIELSDARGAGL